jgi:hypothetical protein
MDRRADAVDQEFEIAEWSGFCSYLTQGRHAPRSFHTRDRGRRKSPCTRDR